MITLTTAVANALIAENVPLVLFVELDFASGFLRLNTSGVNLTWNSVLWTGAGALGSIEPIEEGNTLEARGVALALSGIPTSILDTALEESYQGRNAKIYVAPLDAGHAIIANPVLRWAGRMDNMLVELGQSATITLRCESRLADWDRPRVRRYNHQDQQAEYPGDLGFQYVEQMAEKPINWGFAKK